MLREKTTDAAVRALADGKRVMVMSSCDDEGKTFMLKPLIEFLNRYRFLVDENATTDTPDSVMTNVDGAAAGTAGSAAEPRRKRVGAGGKRKQVDVGKILALHNAGWTNKAIAEEMKMGGKMVWYYIDKARKEMQDGETDGKEG